VHLTCGLFHIGTRLVIDSPSGILITPAEAPAVVDYLLLLAYLPSWRFNGNCAINRLSGLAAAKQSDSVPPAERESLFISPQRKLYWSNCPKVE